VELFLKGLVAGFIVAMPSGPVSVLCFRRVLTGTLLIGLVTVFGGAAADTIYGMVAALGITAITHLIETHKFWLREVAGLFLLIFGISMIRAKIVDRPGDDTSAASLHKAFFSTFGLMMVNPVVIFSFFAVLGWLGLTVHHPGAVDGGLLACGLFLGSSAWWLVYKFLFVVIGDSLRSKGLHVINVVAGGLICFFGVWELIAGFRGHH
jgi:threonine/homoserine/homoserine lactone efflux protein